MIKATTGDILRILVLLAPGLFFLMSCSSNSGTTLERIKKEKVVRVGFANGVSASHTTPEGKLTGEAPEIARKVLAKMGIHNIEGVLIEFGSLIPALKAGRFDMIAAGMFITPERCREIAFSEPTFMIGQAFLVKSGNPKNLHSYVDVKNNPEVVLCVMEGTVEGEYARAVGISDSRIILVPDTLTGAAAVREGSADVLALDSLSIHNLVDSLNDPGIERAEPFQNPIIKGRAVRGYGAFGFRKEDVTFYNEFNEHLKKFIGSKGHLRIMKNFGFTKLPGKITAEDLCNGS